MRQKKERKGDVSKIRFLWISVMSWNDVVNAKGGWPRFDHSEWLRKGWGQNPGWCASKHEGGEGRRWEYPWAECTVRPMLNITRRRYAGFMIGDSFEYCGYEWCIISSGHAVMKDIIRDEKGEPVFVPYRRCKECRTVFHDDEGYEMSASMFRDENGKKLYGWDASDYENSDLRKFVEAWAEEKGMKFECGYPLREGRRGGYDEEL